MRLFSILLALLVAASLYLLVVQRDEVIAFAQGGADPGDGAVSAGGTAGEAAPQAVAVAAIRSSAREIDSVVVVRGRTEAARQVEVRAETSGKVMSDPLRRGASVERGDLLCELDPGTREVALAEARARLIEARAAGPAAEARLAEAEARLAEAQINDTAASRLSQEGFASQTRVASTKAAMESARAAVEAAKSGLDAASAQVQSAEAGVAAAERELQRLRITAPFAGILESDTAELGALMQPGGLCATVIRLDPIKLVGFVPETEVDRVRVGAAAEARLASGQSVSGSVSFLSRSADPQTRTFRVDVDVPNEDLAIRDGLTVEIRIGADGRRAHLLPQSALTLDDTGALGVRVVSDGQTAQFVPVTVLRDSVEGIWVSGLDDEVSVIVVGQEYVTDGVPVAASYEGPSR
ncbi:MAG: efflux RND transporter periplasmic adaptor subunit [Tranquillimonas sp.]|jgi:multidrug efflux system membrane fusion protein